MAKPKEEEVNVIAEIPYHDEANNKIRKQMIDFNIVAGVKEVENNRANLILVSGGELPTNLSYKDLCKEFESRRLTSEIIG